MIISITAKLGGLIGCCFESIQRVELFWIVVNGLRSRAEDFVKIGQLVEERDLYIKRVVSLWNRKKMGKVDRSSSRVSPGYDVCKHLQL